MDQNKQNLQMAIVDSKYGVYKSARKAIVGILALSTCTNITCSGTYAVLKLVVDDVYYILGELI